MDISTHFDRLEMPRRFALDLDVLERHYLERARLVHPDHRQFVDDEERRLSLQQAAELNEAYRCLADPFRRAEYLLELEGGPSVAEVRNVEADFLEEMLERRMKIEDVREAHPPDSQPRLALERELTDRKDAVIERIAACFDRLASDDADRPALLRRIRQELNAARYVSGLLRDLRED